MLGEIIKTLCDNHFVLNECAMLEMSPQQCHQLVELIPSFNEYGELSDALSSGPVVALLISGMDAVNRLNQLLAGICQNQV